MIVTFVFRLLIVIAAFGFASCVHMGDSPEDARRKEQSSAMRKSSEDQIQAALTLGANDVFQVNVFKEAELSGLYRVDVNGLIQFPLIGEVQATGHTAGEIAAEIQQRLSEYIKEPYVSLFVKEYNSKKIYVFGEVSKPGTFSFEEGMNIVQAITLAGGFSQKASPNSSSVTRRVNGKEKRFVVRVEDVARGKEENVLLIPGDIVFVPEAFF